MILFIIGAFTLIAATTPSKPITNTTKDFVERGHMDRIK